MNDVATDPASGLSTTEAERLLAIHGKNEIARQRDVSPWAILLSQLRGAMPLLLLGAGAVSILLGEEADAIAIGAILVLNAVVGFLQEYRAERAVHALRSMTAPRARAMRDGHAAVIPAAAIVPGDVLLLEAGDIVAADARLLEAHGLVTIEAPLTGESAPVEKDASRARDGAPLAERVDRVFLGTSVGAGTGRALVDATGMGTELGKIAGLIDTADSEATPLEKQLAAVGAVLIRLCAGIVLVVALVGLLRGLPAADVLLSSVSLAVAAVPEGLATVVTIALAVGVQRMAARHVLVRRLPSVETLGCATVICTDKTGTLTTGVMTVREVWGRDATRVLFAASACSDAELGPDGRGGVGDPTEVAILAAARERGIDRAEIERTRPRREVAPFDSSTRRMAILRADGVRYLKGAVEAIVPACSAQSADAMHAHADLAARGLRVLAVATVPRGEDAPVLEGLVGVADPPRPEAIAALERARQAGIRTVMITGDHRTTALAIAREMGLVASWEDGDELVHARATAEDKLRIVRSWKERGAVVAMTGDGVNDAPALREAHVGIAMGKSGTEVTREASDMILADDNYASIVAAVAEGRGVYENIQKTLVYLLTGNAGELLVMLGAGLLGLPLPLLPLQLLWVNLVTDGLPALALVMDPAPRDALSRPPRAARLAMLGRAQWRRILGWGTLEALLVLGTFGAALRGGAIEEARAMAFSVLVFAELLRSFSARSTRLLFWEVGAFTNLKLLAVVFVSVCLQLGVHHLPITRELFGIRELSPLRYAVALLLGLVPVSAIELAKLGRRVASPRAT